MSSAGFRQVGFIGLGVMGEPMCRNLALKAGARGVAHDRDAEPLRRRASHGVAARPTAREVMVGSELVFLSLPSGEVVHALAHAVDDLLASVRPGGLHKVVKTLNNMGLFETGVRAWTTAGTSRPSLPGLEITITLSSAVLSRPEFFLHPNVH